MTNQGNVGEDSGDEELAFDDDPGESDVEWKQLPPEREFFATPYDPPVKALVQEIREGDLIVRPTFQRYAVWDVTRQSKFIESILLNIPIPNLFFAEDDDQTRVVVDGQQRLNALKSFMENRFALRGLEVLVPLKGKRFDELSPRQQKIIGNRTLRCLVISAKSDSEIRFQVFERLNQGGMPLNAQEVRHCVYRGVLNDLLHELVAHPEWLSALGTDKAHPRMSDCELVLRFFALRDALPNYSPPLKSLLNNFMRANRHAPPPVIVTLRDAFFSALRPVIAAFGTSAFRRLLSQNGGIEVDKAPNRAVYDVEMLLMEGIDVDWAQTNRTRITECLAGLCSENGDFQDAVSRATADRARLRTRLTKWRVALEGIEAALPNAERSEIPQDG
jgi:hypothetical protein